MPVPLPAGAHVFVATCVIPASTIGSKEARDRKATSPSNQLKVRRTYASRNNKGDRSLFQASPERGAIRKSVALCARSVFERPRGWCLRTLGVILSAVNTSCVIAVAVTCNLVLVIFKIFLIKSLPPQQQFLDVSQKRVRARTDHYCVPELAHFIRRASFLAVRFRDRLAYG